MHPCLTWFGASDVLTMSTHDRAEVPLQKIGLLKTSLNTEVVSSRSMVGGVTLVSSTAFSQTGGRIEPEHPEQLGRTRHDRSISIQDRTGGADKDGSPLTHAKKGRPSVCSLSEAYRARDRLICWLFLSMSPEAVTADRIVHDLRRMLRHGELGIGIPLVVHTLADGFGVSITPVRDALNRLVGEQLVELQPGGGFAVPSVTQERAVSLYEWHADIIGAVLRAEPDPGKLGPVPEVLRVGPTDVRVVAALTVDLFDRLAASARNPERRLALVRVADRLHMLRLHEGYLARQGAELLSLWHALRSGDKRVTRLALARYHRRRFAHAGQIAVAAMGSIRINPRPS